MGKQKQEANLETIAASEGKIMEAKKSLAAKLPYYGITAISAGGTAFSLYVAGVSAYEAVAEYLKVTPTIIASTPADDPSPYQNTIGYGIVIFFALLAAGVFIKTAIDAIKHSRE